MTRQRYQLPLAILLLGSLLCVSGAWAGNRNFENTVGIHLARLSSPVEPDQLPDSRLLTQLRCTDLCELQPSAGKRLQVPTAYPEDDRFDRRLRSGYRQLGERLASRLWDDPAGRRVKFDIEGRPGIGLEIPFN